MTQIKVISSCKIGKSTQNPDYSQDALAKNEERGLFAVSDGVSQSYFSEFWSQLLVDHFCSAKDDDIDSLFQSKDITYWLSSIQNEWKTKVEEIISSKKMPLEISNRHLRKDPAAATFIGLQLIANLSGDKSFRAMIVGDSVLFHLRNNELLKSFIIEKSSQFTQKTTALVSYPDKSDQPSFFSGVWKNGDEFILATDAIAKWLLLQKEKNQDSWHQAMSKVKDLKGYRFEQFVKNQENDTINPLDVDDITFLIISGNEESDPVNAYISGIKAKSQATVEMPTSSTLNQKSLSDSYATILQTLVRIDSREEVFSEIQKSLKNISNIVDKNAEFAKELKSISSRLESDNEYQTILEKIDKGKEFDPEIKNIVKKLATETVTEISLKKALDSIINKIEQNTEKLSNSGELFDFNLKNYLDSMVFKMKMNDEKFQNKLDFIVKGINKIQKLLMTLLIICGIGILLLLFSVSSELGINRNVTSIIEHLQTPATYSMVTITPSSIPLPTDTFEVTPTPTLLTINIPTATLEPGITLQITSATVNLGSPTP